MICRLNQPQFGYQSDSLAGPTRSRRPAKGDSKRTWWYHYVEIERKHQKVRMTIYFHYALTRTRSKLMMKFALKISDWEQGNKKYRKIPEMLFPEISRWQMVADYLIALLISRTRQVQISSGTRLHSLFFISLECLICHDRILIMSHLRSYQILSYPNERHVCGPTLWCSASVI